MNLQTLQRTMARVVMRPLTASDRMQRFTPTGQSMQGYATRFIKPNDRLTSFQRLQIYNQQYWWRVISSLMDDFVGLRAVLGDKRFEAMCKAYMLDCPSRSYTLRDLGSNLETWLRRHPQWAGRKKILAVDLASLEWAEIEAFDERSEPAFLPEHVSGLARLPAHLRLQPYIRLLHLRYPVDELLIDLREDGDETDVASNAVLERRKRKRIRKIATLRPQPIFLAVHRVDNSVYFRRLEAGEFAALQTLREGKTVQQAIRSAVRETRNSAEEMASAVERWFRNWTALGWFCAPEKESSKAGGR
ncbi:MAG: DNA-binding domain-containing protein [Acidobacteriia bacterium]|nr:DNA-binding domain-containing protein [Terriglobia bacterium]